MPQEANATSAETLDKQEITKSIASKTTQAAFQSGQHNRWLAAVMRGEHADIELAGLQRIQLCKTIPIDRKTLCINSVPRLLRPFCPRIPPGTRGLFELSTYRSTFIPRD